MSMLYQSYRLPPDSKCIRVIDIMPIPPTAIDPDNEPITSELRIINLDDRPRFTALSYVHGTYAPIPHFITCNNLQVNITSNCHSALRHLRKKLGKVTIWFDAVCINQDDLDEKSQQIPLMGDIYSAAELVYIWLGDGTAGTDRAMAYMANAGFPQYYKITAEGKLRCRSYAAAWCLFTRKLRRTNHPLPLHRSIKPRFGGQYTTVWDLEDLLSKDWITRLWTYQEILLASNPIVVCGDWHVPWSSFERSVLFLDNISLDLHGMIMSWTSVALSRERLQKLSLAYSGSEASALETYILFVKKIMNVRYWYFPIICFFILLGAPGIIYDIFVAVSLNKPKIKFFIFILLVLPVCFGIYVIALVSQSRLKYEKLIKEGFIFGLYYRTATNPKDMAYGMWAILGRGGVANLPTPNYSRDTGDIYRILTVHLAQMTRSLDLLLLAAAQGVHGQPSWVPDWSAHKKQKWGNLGKLPPTDEHGNHLTNNSVSWEVMPRVKPTAHFEIDETQTILTIRARHIGDISKCLRFQRTSNDFHESEREIHIENLRLMLLCASGQLRKLVRTSFSRHIINEDWSPKYLLEIFRTDVRSALSERNPQHIESWHSFCIKNCDKDPSRIISLLFNNQDIFSIQIAMCNVLAEEQRILFYAQKPDKSGRGVFGTCSRNVQVNDQILRFEGVPQLLVVRPQHGARRSVGIISPAVRLTAFEWNAHKNPIMGMLSVLPRALKCNRPENLNEMELEERYFKYQVH
ncbi:hypothetical protein GJ744_000352 [Endocarpon pusillum]|uniref:Heterokaryon incompatibility domain-containing protein n=1 Tax=Endocarpon pusillum TaxID=364733 RepID=A0A8H7E8W1_9EURO|nr:hypothetical protein GJ744_000352 [Endocarpon pusillum]